MSLDIWMREPACLCLDRLLCFALLCNRNRDGHSQRKITLQQVRLMRDVNETCGNEAYGDEKYEAAPERFVFIARRGGWLAVGLVLYALKEMSIVFHPDAGIQ